MDAVSGRDARIHRVKNGDHAGSSAAPSSSDNAAPPPPYWTRPRARAPSNASVDSFLPGSITLHDNTTPQSDTSAACWAKSVTIPSYAVVTGNLTGIGAFVVWNIKIETLRGTTIDVKKRYSEFDTLRHDLLMTFPLSEASMPPLPPKGVISNFRPKFLEQRRVGLQYFINCILLNPEFSSSPVVKDFLFA